MDIPGFKLGRQYAEGPFCKGYNALNLSNHKTVNIQVFDNALLDSQAFVDEFREITTRLAGTSIGIMTPILQAEISEQACYVISEYFPTPQQLPAAPPALSRAQVLTFAQLMAQTLDQLHQAGLAHGSIELSALDFRASDTLVLRPPILQRVIPMLRPKAITSLDPVQRRYLAPEAVEQLTPATDYFALGVLTYQLMFDSFPFDGDTGGRLETDAFKGEHKDLEAFFWQLLAADVRDRIQSLAQFTAALQQCGVEIADKAPSAFKRTQGRGAVSAHGQTASPSAFKWLLPASGLAVAALAGGLYWFLPGEAARTQPQQPVRSEMSAANTAGGETEPALPATASATQQPAETSPELENLYQQALAQIETNPQAALVSVDALLKQKPSHIKAMRLKLRIEREISVSATIATAERQMQEQKLLQPSGDNAYESYLLLADMLSADDERVRRGFNRIAAAYHDMAENMFEQDLLDQAGKYVELGLSVSEKYPPLVDLRMRIDERTKTLERKRRQARLRQEQRQQQKAQRQLESREQQREAEALARQQQARQQAEEKAQEQAQSAQQITMQLAREQSKQSRVNALLASANDYLNRNELTLNNIMSAHRDYEALIKIDSVNPQVKRLQKDLIDAYSILGNRENNEALYTLALQALEQGVQMSPQDKKKMQIRAQLAR